LVAKTILGIPIGMVQVAQTTYINEVAPPQVRGAALANYSLFFGLGQLFASIALQIVESTVPLQWLRVIYSEWVLVGLSM
jgi:MFS family permease